MAGLGADLCEGLGRGAGLAMEQSGEPSGSGPRRARPPEELPVEELPVDAAGQGRGPTLIGSVQRALRLLEAVGGFRHGATAKQLARAADLPLGTTYHLRTG